MHAIMNARYLLYPQLWTSAVELIVCFCYTFSYDIWNSSETGRCDWQELNSVFSGYPNFVICHHVHICAAMKHIKIILKKMICEIFREFVKAERNKTNV